MEEALKFAVEENGRTARVGGFVGKVIQVAISMRILLTLWRVGLLEVVVMKIC